MFHFVDNIQLISWNEKDKSLLIPEWKQFKKKLYILCTFRSNLQSAFTNTESLNVVEGNHSLESMSFTASSAGRGGGIYQWVTTENLGGRNKAKVKFHMGQILLCFRVRMYTGRSDLVLTIYGRTN